MYTSDLSKRTKRTRRTYIKSELKTLNDFSGYTNKNNNINIKYSCIINALSKLYIASWTSSSCSSGRSSSTWLFTNSLIYKEFSKNLCVYTSIKFGDGSVYIVNTGDSK